MLTKAEEPSLPYYLPIAGGRIIGFIPFPRVLVLCEMQSVSSRVWTRVAVSKSYDDNHYTTGTSMEAMVILIVIPALWMITKGAQSVGKWRTSRDYINYSFIEIDLNTEKSFGDLRDLAVTQHPLEVHQFTLGWKTRNNNDNNSFCLILIN